ncbi:unnamed protein product [Gordionus sp. m RMFG-2023]
MALVVKKVQKLFGKEEPAYEEDIYIGRQKWSSHLEFILACVGCSVGIGNVWRFPTTCYENGGGAFLIPYLFMLLTIGKPMYLMELGMGQFTRQGPPGCFNFVPIAKGCGFAMLLISINVAIYYNVIMVFTLYYSFASLQKKLPWTHCGNSFNTPNCLEFNYTNPNEFRPENATTPTEEYWERKVLESYKSSGIDDIGMIKMDLLIWLAISWLIVFLILFKGVNVTGKVVYVTATMPYFILSILLIKGLTLKGSGVGISYFLYPEFKKLLSPIVWQKAAGQMFFSLSVTMGGLQTLSSYISFNNNCHRDAIMVSLLDTFTSLMAGFVIFSILGFMAKLKHTTVDKVVAGGVGLAFIVYPEALSQLPVPQFWNLIFFIMLYTLGIDSQIMFIETVQAALHDQFPSNFPRKNKSLICGALCFGCFILGFPCLTRGGMLVLDIMDHYCANICCVIVGIVEVLAIMWLYGFEKFTKDISYMLGFELPHKRYWQISWAYIAPTGLIFVCGAYFVQSIFIERRLISGSYVYPVWAQFIGWTLFCVIIFQIPLWAYLRMRKKFHNAVKPSPSFDEIRPKSASDEPGYHDKGHDNPLALTNLQDEN